MRIVNWAINVLIVLIVIDAILSWIPEIRWRYREVSRWLDRLTEPVLSPFRRLLPPHKTGGIDISPLLAIIALQIIQRIIISLPIR